jgi:YgiT-type zinc finger domain-containing protein
MKVARKTLKSCVYCGGVLRRGTAPFHADRAGYHVHWDSVPAWVCGQCGEAAFDASTVQALQDAMTSLDQHASHLTASESG